MKRIISIILAALLTLSAAAPVSAEELFAETTETPAEVIVCEESDITDTTVPNYEDLDDNDEDPDDPEEPDEPEGPEIYVPIVAHTEQEVREYLNNHPVNFKEKVTYAKKPKYNEAPYDPGRLSDETLNSALTLINNYRYIAGFEEPLTLSEDLNEMGQAAALVNKVNHELSHYPTKPKDMDEDLYYLGLSGSARSNLCRNLNLTMNEFITACINDSDGNNIDGLGHRYNSLSPFCTQIGFGEIDEYMAMTQGIPEDTGFFIDNQPIWPARETPIEYFWHWSYGYSHVPAWSYDTGNYEKNNNIHVTLTRLSDNKTWNFGEAKGLTDDGYFNISNYGYIVFRPSGSGTDLYRDGERYHVEITGTSVGTVSYDVHFFSIGETPDPEDPEDEDPEDPEVTEYTVTFETNGGTTVDPITAEENTKIILPDDPTREGFYFGGWFTDPELTRQFNPSTKITSDLTLYAAWRTAPTYIVGQSIDMKSQYFSTLGASKYTVTLTESGEDASKYATVSGKGILTAKKPGNITVTPLNHEEAAVQITLLPKPLIKFPKVLTYQGQTINVYDYFADNWADYGVKPIKLVSSNTKVATIDEDGNITAKEGNGTTTISAIFSEKNKNGATNNLKFTAKLTVKHPKFAKASYQMQTGQKLAIGMSNVTKTTDINWSTSDPDKLSAVAQLDKKGAKTGKVLLTAYECGEYTLTANIDGHDYTCSMIVKKPAIKKATLRIKCGKTGTVALKDTKINKNDVVWKSSNEEIATVDAGGVVTAKSIGDVTIYTETGGTRNECVVTVW